MSYILSLLGSFHPSRCAWLRDLVFGLGQEGRDLVFVWARSGRQEEGS